MVDFYCKCLFLNPYMDYMGQWTCGKYPQPWIRAITKKNKVYTLDTWLRYWKIDGFVWIQSNDWFETCRTMDIRPWARFHTIEKKQSKEQLVLDFWSCFLFARWTLSLFAGHLLNLIQLNNVWLNRAGFQWFHHPYSPKQPGFFVTAWASVWWKLFAISYWPTSNTQRSECGAS